MEAIELLCAGFVPSGVNTFERRTQTLTAFAKYLLSEWNQGQEKLRGTTAT
jgi:hypothetical protein